MENEMPQNLDRAEFVKHERKIRAWTQAQLAEIVDVSTRTIQRLETHGAAAFDTLMGVADAFGIDVKELNEFSEKSKTNAPQRRVHHLRQVLSGKNLYDIIKDADQFQIEHDESRDPRAIGAMKDMIKMLKGDIVRLHDSNPEKRINIEQEMSQELKGIEQFGFYLFGIKRDIPVASNKNSYITMSTLYMSHLNSPKIIRDKNFNMAIPALLTEVAK